MATFQEMIDEVQFHIGNRTDKQTTVEDKINEATLEVALMVKAPEFMGTRDITAVDATPNYALQSDEYAVLGVRDSTKQRRLKRGSWEEYDELDETKTGDPTKWFRYGNNIYIYDDVPDDTTRTILLRSLDRPTEMTAVTDTFPLSLEWREPVALRAAWKMSIYLGNGKADDKKALFMESMEFVLKIHQGIEDKADTDATARSDTHRRGRTR